MSFYGGNQNGGQPGPGQQQQMGRQSGNPGMPNVQQVLTPQLFNINVNPNQLHNFFNEHNHNQQQNLQLNAAAAANASSLLIQQQPQFPVNLINEQLGVGVGQLLSSASVSQNQMQGLPISMSSALNFPQTLQVHTQAAQSQSGGQSQGSKQKVFTGTVTKTHDNFGFIDEEVFFQMGVVKGPILPKEGDRVLVEADFNASMPFKWNATRVQIVNIGGGINSGMNNMNNMSASQSQHNMGFNTGVGMQKQPTAPSQPRAQPVAIVSNPHSVYSGSTGNSRMIRPSVSTVVPQVGPIAQPPREPLKRPAMGINHAAPDPPSFNVGSSSSGSGITSSERDREREMDRERDRRERERSRERARERSRERERRDRERSLERPRHRSRSRERRDKMPRARSRSRERLPIRDRSREKSPPRKRSSRDRSRERVDRVPRDRDASRARSRSRDRDRNARPREKEKVKTDMPPSDKPRDRSRDRDRKVSDLKNGKDSALKSSSPSTIAPKNNKDEPRVDRNKDKEKDKRGAERTKSAASLASDRAKRSRSRDSVRTNRGHGPMDRSRSRSVSPRRKNALCISPLRPRYAVELPKFSLDAKDITGKEIQRRYPNLYVPSDLFHVSSTWNEAFPLHAPFFEICRPCPVQIMRRQVERITVELDQMEDRVKNAVYEADDSSNLFKAKVMIPSLSSLTAIYRKACGINDDGVESPDNIQQIERLVNFIVGMKTAKHEVFALGGKWSPSLDGGNPQSDNQTLINTAIRCVSALAGIDLSGCKHWYRVMELYYKRESSIQTVVFFLPDVWSCLPSTKDWSKLKSLYKFALYGDKSDLVEKKIEATSAENVSSLTVVKSAEVPPTDSNIESSGSAANGVNSAAEPDSVGTEAAAVVDGGEVNESGETCDPPKVGGTGAQEEDELNTSGLLVIDEAGSPSKEDGVVEDPQKSQELSSNTMDVSLDNGGISMEVSQEQTDIDDSVVRNSDENIAIVEGELSTATQEAQDAPNQEESETTVATPAEVSLPSLPSVNPKNMNVAQLREELSRRGLSPKGLKPVLVQRLVKTIKDQDEMEKPEDKVEPETQANGKEDPVVQEDAATAPMELQESIPDHPLQTEDNASSSKAISDEIENRDENADSVKQENEDSRTEDESCIRLVNPTLILEDPDADDDASIEDGEVKEDLENGIKEPEFNGMEFLSKFPPETFPKIKPEMKEEEVKVLERRYTLPKNPRLLMFPSDNVKNGNFDCISMSLDVLRDYRIIDKKEENFEVSLFSEFFHEMLQRDFAFRIYREIVAEAGKEEIVSQESKDVKTEVDKNEPATKRRKVSNTSSVALAPTTKKITDPYLFLSFIFFDVTRCGYITESDLEDLFGCLGCGFTRSQVRKVVQKVVQKGNLYYRKWTDRPEASRNKQSIEDVKLLAKGNFAFFPIFALQEDLGSSNSNAIVDNEANTDAVVAQVDGKEVDVKKLLAQLESVQRNLAVAESSLNVIKNSLNESKSQVADLKKSNESLRDELLKTKDSLKKSESAEKSARDNADVFRRATERYCERVKDLVKFPTSSSSSGSIATKEKTDMPSLTKENASLNSSASTPTANDSKST